MNTQPQDYAKTKDYYSVWPTMGKVLTIVISLYTLYLAFGVIIHQDTSVNAQIRSIKCIGVK